MFNVTFNMKSSMTSSMMHAGNVRHSGVAFRTTVGELSIDALLLKSCRNLPRHKHGNYTLLA